jgi:uncharacterized protein YndB with AHSA1/START domain
MKWIVRALILIALLILLVVAMGSLLPKQHTVTRQASYHQPPEAIWQAITDYQKFPEWRKTVLRVEPFPSVNGNPAWTEVADHDMKIPLQVTESVPPTRLVTRIADPKLPWGGTWTTEIIPAATSSNAGATTVRITENGEVANPIFRFMARFVFGYTSTIDTYLKALGQKFGEQITIQD